MLPDRDLAALPALGLWVAAGAGALSLVAFRRPRQPWRQWSCPVPCAGDRLQRGFRVLGGNSTVFQRFPVRTAGRCHASRLRGPARARPGVAGGGRGGPSEAALFAGTDASAAPPLLPIPVCRPHVYRAKLNTTASGRSNAFDSFLSNNSTLRDAVTGGQHAWTISSGAADSTNSCWSDSPRPRFRRDLPRLPTL